MKPAVEILGWVDGEGFQEKNLAVLGQKASHGDWNLRVKKVGEPSSRIFHPIKK